MNAGSDLKIKVKNPFSFSIDLYQSTTKTPISHPDELTTDSSDYEPIYTLLQSVDAHTSEDVPFPNPETNPFLLLVAVRSEDAFPIFSQMFDSFSSSLGMDLQENYLQECQNAWECYLDIQKNPYAPFPVEYQKALLDNAVNDTALRKKTKEVLEKYGYTCNFEELNLIHYWAKNDLHSCLQEENEQLLYVYEGMDYVNTANFLMKKSPIGYLKIYKDSSLKKAMAIYSSSKGFENPVSCAYEGGVLTPNSSDVCPLHLLYNFTIEGSPFKFCFTGTKVESGKKRLVIAQPTPRPDLPWWIILYDLSYAAYEIVQVGMCLQMLYHLLKALKQGVEFLAKNASKIVQSIRSRLSQIGRESNPYSEVEELPEDMDVDPMNVDVDVDTEIDTVVDTVEDTVVDTEIDTVTNIDTNIDTNIIIDFPFDLTDVVVDVNVDVDVDTVVDTVEDTVVDTEIDTVTDTVIDTSIESIAEGTITKLLKSIGKWIITKGWKFLLKNAAIILAFQAVDKLLSFWRKHAEEELNHIMPQEVTGLGLLTNYMLNERNSVEERWSVFSDFVQELNTYPDDDQNGWKNSQDMQKIALTMIVSSGKQASSKIGWAKKDRESLVTKMLAYRLPTNQHQAYKDVLGTYQFANRPLPVTAAAAVAKTYLSKVTT